MNVIGAGTAHVDDQLHSTESENTTTIETHCHTKTYIKFYLVH
jgi:hypothetical protein